MVKRLFFSLCLLMVAMITSANDFTVVIDAGHGGKDPGAVSANGRVYEKNVTLKVALLVGESIARNHPEVKVLYTRKTDVFVGLNDRARMANKADADLFISIHVNAAKHAVPPCTSLLYKAVESVVSKFLEVCYGLLCAYER